AEPRYDVERARGAPKGSLLAKLTEVAEQSPPEALIADVVPRSRRCPSRGVSSRAEQRSGVIRFEAAGLDRGGPRLVGIGSPEDRCPGCGGAARRLGPHSFRARTTSPHGWAFHSAGSVQPLGFKSSKPLSMVHRYLCVHSWMRVVERESSV